MHLALMKLGFSKSELQALPYGEAAGYLAAAVPDGKKNGGGGAAPKTYKVRRRNTDHGK